MTAILAAIGATLAGLIAFLFQKNKTQKAEAARDAAEKDKTILQQNNDEITKKVQDGAKVAKEEVAKREQATKDAMKQAQDLREKLDETASAQDVIDRIKQHFNEGEKK